MSWRQGLEIYLDVVKAIDQHDFDADHRLDLKAELLAVFLANDIDPGSLDDYPEIEPIFARMVEINARLEREY